MGAFVQMFFACDWPGCEVKTEMLVPVHLGGANVSLVRLTDGLPDNMMKAYSRLLCVSHAVELRIQMHGPKSDDENADEMLRMIGSASALLLSEHRWFDSHGKLVDHFPCDGCGPGEKVKLLHPVPMLRPWPDAPPEDPPAVCWCVRAHEGPCYR